MIRMAPSWSDILSLNIKHLSLLSQDIIIKENGGNIINEAGEVSSKWYLRLQLYCENQVGGG